MVSKASKKTAQEPIKFSNDDIDMIRGPLIDMLRGREINNLTIGKKLVIGLLLIAVKKAKVIVDIRKEKKSLRRI
jgi:hypothetical protein